MLIAFLNFQFPAKEDLRNARNENFVLLKHRSPALGQSSALKYALQSQMPGNGTRVLCGLSKTRNQVFHFGQPLDQPYFCHYIKNHRR